MMSTEKENKPQHKVLRRNWVDKFYPLLLKKSLVLAREITVEKIRWQWFTQLNLQRCAGEMCVWGQHSYYFQGWIYFEYYWCQRNEGKPYLKNWILIKNTAADEQNHNIISFQHMVSIILFLAMSWMCAFWFSSSLILKMLHPLIFIEPCTCKFRN